MTRRAPRRQGPRPTALFAWDANGAVVEDQADDAAARRNPCPHCHARPWQPCTAPGRRGRRTLRGVHPGRRPQETQ